MLKLPPLLKMPLQTDMSADILKSCFLLDQVALPSSCWSLPLWQELVSKDYYRLFTLLESSHIVGFALWQVDVADNFAHLLKVAVNPQQRGKGYGKELLDRSERFLRDELVRKFYLEVATDNLFAIRLYKQQGYSCLRTIDKFYSNGDSAAVYFKEKHC